MIEKLLGMPTGCHTSLEEITAVEKADRGCKMVIKCILIKLFHHKTKRNLKTTADYYPHHASWMACARNYSEMRAEMVTNYFTLDLSAVSFPESLSLCFSQLSALTIFLFYRITWAKTQVHQFIAFESTGNQWTPHHCGLTWAEGKLALAAAC